MFTEMGRRRPDGPGRAEELCRWRRRARRPPQRGGCLGVGGGRAACHRRGQATGQGKQRAGARRGSRWREVRAGCGDRRPSRHRDRRSAEQGRPRRRRDAMAGINVAPARSSWGAKPPAALGRRREGEAEGEWPPCVVGNRSAEAAFPRVADTRPSCRPSWSHADPSHSSKAAAI